MKPAQLFQLLFIFVAAVFVYGFVATAKEGELRRSCGALCSLAPNYAATNRVAPDFELPNLTGQRRKLSDYKGKAIILNFWSKTCQPCLEEMPSLAALARSLQKRGDVVLLTVSIDESADDARATLGPILGPDIPFEVLMDPESQVVAGRFGTKLYPETWFIDQDFVVRARVDGARDWSTGEAVALVDSFRAPLTCGIDFRRGRPDGPDAGLCGESLD
ncbi:MAG TPA: TlpA disulfide reductase family protein [Polyangiaceae bacterium]|nr:TlpA disulfide reductase family protein [Polyangiaceae bacterium]